MRADRASRKTTLLALGLTAVSLGLAALSGAAWAQDGDAKPVASAATAKPSGTASARPASSAVRAAPSTAPAPAPAASAATAMPAGHPVVSATVDEASGDDVDPSGGDGSDADQMAAGGGGDPHGEAAAGTTGPSGMFQPWPDKGEDTDRLPAGSIEIEIRDENDKPVGGVDVTLGVINQSIAKGESRKHLSGSTSGNGKLRFDHLETGSHIAYRVSVPKDGASFAATPFQLTQTKGRSVVLHVYPVTHDITKALIVMQTLVYVELKDDRIQLQEALNIFNFGKTTWVPEDLVVSLPEDFTALTSQQMMSDQGVDAIDKKGFKLHGTFPPGRHEVEFRYQLPYDGKSQVDFALGAPPHVASARVMVAASQQMSVQVAGFPAAQATTDMQGNHILVTEREMLRSDNPLDAMHVSLSNIPTRGAAHLVATGIAGSVVLFGLVMGFATLGKRTEPDPKAKKRDRNRLLEELEGLERAHAAGDVGPKTYERARRELIDAIARTLV